MKFRIGHGFDVHAFEEGDHIMLGGIKIPHTHGIKAHSDGDVVLHSITDALLGALGMGDLGHWFPDTDPELADIESRDLILPIIMSMREKGFELNNIDVTIVAQAPKIGPYSEAICTSVAEIFSADESVINIKATTTEHLGYIGRKEGISAHTVISLIDAETLKESHVKPSESDSDDHTIDLTGDIDIKAYNFDD